MKKPVLAFAVAAIAALVVTSYQNCSSSTGSGSSSYLANGIGSKGNGDSYEGKVEEFVAMDRLGLCGKGPDYPSAIIRVDKDGNATIVRDKCVDQPPAALPVQDYEQSPDAPEILTMAGNLFESQTYLANSAPGRGVWACRTRLPLEKSRNHARITVRILKTASGAFKSILSYAVYDPGGKLLNIRKTGNIEMSHVLNDKGVATYRDANMSRNDLFLRVQTQSKLGVIGFLFKRDPKWESTQGVDETKDQEVLQPLGKFRSEKVTCYGDERSSP